MCSVETPAEAERAAAWARTAAAIAGGIGTGVPLGPIIMRGTSFGRASAAAIAVEEEAAAAAMGVFSLRDMLESPASAIQNTGIQAIEGGENSQNKLISSSLSHYPVMSATLIFDFVKYKTRKKKGKRIRNRQTPHAKKRRLR
jgi:hypothetical protein